MKTKFRLDTLGGGYEINSPQIVQSDWTVQTYHGKKCLIPHIKKAHSKSTLNSALEKLAI